MSKYQHFKILEKKKIFPSWKIFIWKFFSFLGENFYKKKPPLIIHLSNKMYLNLGAGDEIKEGFVNADFYRFHKLFTKNNSEWFIDLSKTLNCKNDYWDGIYLCHVSEHLTYVDNYKILKELLRVIKPGCVLRIVVPDLNTYLKYEQNKDNFDNRMNEYNSLPEAISCLTQNHQHMSVWNYDLMKEVLIEIGFSKVEKVKFGLGKNEDLIIDHKSKEWESFYCEAIK